MRPGVISTWQRVSGRDIQIKRLLFHFQWSFKFYFSAVDVTATITVAGSTEDRDGQSYMIMRQFDLKPEIGKLTTNFDGLFREPELNQVAVELVNNNWQAMYKVMVDQAKNIWEPFLLQQANAFFSVISYDKMFA